MNRLVVLGLVLIVSCTDKKAAPLGLKFDGADGFSESSRAALSVKQNPAEEVRMKKGESEILIRSVNGAPPESFDKAVALRSFELAQPFRLERSPYPGAVTDSVRCPANFMPRQTKSESGGNRFWRAEVYATARKGPACNDRDFVSKGVELIAYCANKKRLYTVHGYFPKSDNSVHWDSFLASPICKD